MGKLDLTDKEILESSRVIKFLSSLNKTGTPTKYKYFIRDFFKYINKHPDNYIIDGFYFLEGENKRIQYTEYTNDIRDYHIHLKNSKNKKGKNNESTSLDTTFYALKSFFEFYEIEFTKLFWKKIFSKRNKPSTMKKTPDAKQLRCILNNTDLQGKCIFLLMATTGSRISSIVKLQRKHIDIDHEFPRVTVYETKSGLPICKRTTPEVKEYLKTYFDKNKISETDKDKFIFPTPKRKNSSNKNKPMTRENADYKWRKALEHSKLNNKDDKTGIHLMTTQCLKRFFKDNFGKGNKKWVNYFAEHNYNLDRRYGEDLSEKTIDEEYRKGAKFLSIFRIPEDTDSRIKHLTKELEQTKGREKVLSDKSRFLEDEIHEHNKKIEELTSLVTKTIYDKFKPFQSPKVSEEMHNLQEKIISDIFSEINQEVREEYNNLKDKDDYKLVNIDGRLFISKETPELKRFNELRHTFEHSTNEEERVNARLELLKIAQKSRKIIEKEETIYDDYLI